MGWFSGSRGFEGAETRPLRGLAGTEDEAEDEEDTPRRARWWFRGFLTTLDPPPRREEPPPVGRFSRMRVERLSLSFFASSIFWPNLK